MIKIIRIIICFCFLLTFSVFSNAQFSSKFSKSGSYINSCNDYKNNYIGYWKPSHGSPNSIDYDKLRLKIKDEAQPDYKVKSEGVFINLKENAFRIEKNETYKVVFRYQKTDNSNGSENITFRAYLANGISENSNDECKESPLPTISDKQGIYTSNNFLSTTYSGQVKEVVVEFKADKEYTYLWIYGDVLAKYSTGRTNTIKLTSVRIDKVQVISEITNNKIERSHQINSGQTAEIIVGSQPKGGNGSYSYKWQKKTNTSSWNNLSGFSSRSYSPGVLSATTKFRRIVESADKISTSNTVEVTVTNYPEIINNSISRNQTIDEGSYPEMLSGTTPNGGNDSYKYTWQSKTTGNWSDISNTNNINYQPPILDETTFFRRKVKSATLVSYSNELKINVIPLPEITNNSFYFNGNTTLIGSTPSGGNGSYEYLWQIIAYEVDDTPNYYGNTKSVNTIPSNELIFYYRRRVKSYNNVSYTNWKTKNGLLGNNTISFNGNNKITGSLPTGGINSYKYDYYLSINVFGELEDSFINTTRDLNLPPFYLYAINNIPDTKIIVTRVVKSGMESISNTIEINSNSYRNAPRKSSISRKIEDFSEMSYELYPNPVQSNGVIYFNSNVKSQNQDIEIFFQSIENANSHFKIKKQLMQGEIDFRLPELESGIYLYDILIEGKSVKKGKIIVIK